MASTSMRSMRSMRGDFLGEMWLKYVLRDHDRDRGQASTNHNKTNLSATNHVLCLETAARKFEMTHHMSKFERV
jgi:hypothetical protein